MAVCPCRAEGAQAIAEPRREILRVGIVIGRAFGAEPATAEDVHDRRAVEDLVRHRVVFVAQSQIQREVRSYPELVLSVPRIERPPVADHAFSLQVRR